MEAETGAEVASSISKEPAATNISNEQEYKILVRSPRRDNKANQKDNNSEKSDSVKDLTEDGMGANSPEDNIRKWAKKEEWKKIQDFLSNENIEVEMKVKYALTQGIDKEYCWGVDHNLFQWALAKDAPLEFIEYLLEIGCKDNSGKGNYLLEGRDKHDMSELHSAFQYSGNKKSNITVETLKSMLNSGGEELMDAEVNYGAKILHTVCWGHKPSNDVIDLAIDYDPEKETTMNRKKRNEKTRKFLVHERYVNGKLPIDYLLRDSKYSDVPLDAVLHLQKIWYSVDKYTTEIPPNISRTLETIQKKPKKVKDVILQGEYIRAVLNKKIVEPFAIGVMLLDLATQLLVIISYSFLMEKGVRIPVLANTFLIISTIWLFVREVPQLFSGSLSQYMNDTSNWLDLLQLAVLLVTLIGHQEKVDESLLIVSILVSWLRLVFVFGDMFYSIAVFTSSLSQIARKLVSFLFVTAIIVMAFSHSFYVVGPPVDIDCPFNTTSATDWEDGAFACTLRNSYYQSAVMFLSGDWVYLGNYEGTHTWLSMIFAFIVGILLLNIIIAVVSDEFGEVKSNGGKVFWANRLHFIHDLKLLKTFTTQFDPLLDMLPNPFDKWFDALPLERGFIPKLDLWTQNKYDLWTVWGEERYANIVTHETAETLDEIKNSTFAKLEKKRDKKPKTPTEKLLWTIAWFYGDPRSDKHDEKCPYLSWRMMFIFAVVEWKEIFPPSKECCKILIGKSYFKKLVKKPDEDSENSAGNKSNAQPSSAEDHNSAGNQDNEKPPPAEDPDHSAGKQSYKPPPRDYYLLLKAYLAGFVFFIFCIIAFPIVFVLGLVTCGYLWPKELKAYLFCGDVTEGEPSNEIEQIVSESQKKVEELQKKVEESQKKVEDRIVGVEGEMAKLKETTNEILALLKAMNEKK